jgi:hypothetical protein
VKSTLHIELGEGTDPFLAAATRPRKEKFNAFAATLHKLIGAGLISRSKVPPTAIAGTANANGTVTCASVSAADTVTLNGQVLTAVAGAAAANQFSIDGNDIADATALAAAINASAQSLISGILRASNFAATIACASVAAGEWVEVAGHRLTAVAGTAGANQFSIAGSDTADGAALAAAINAVPALKDLVVATAASGTVTIRQRPPAPTNAVQLRKSGAGLTLSGTALAATAVVLIGAVLKGKQGNANTLASSDGTRLAVSGARLTGGTQDAFTF